MFRWCIKQRPFVSGILEKVAAGSWSCSVQKNKINKQTDTERNKIFQPLSVSVIHLEVSSWVLMITKSDKKNVRILGRSGTVVYWCFVWKKTKVFMWRMWCFKWQENQIIDIIVLLYYVTSDHLIEQRVHCVHCDNMSIVHQTGRGTDIGSKPCYASIRLSCSGAYVMLSLPYAEHSIATFNRRVWLWLKVTATCDLSLDWGLPPWW